MARFNVGDKVRCINANGVPDYTGLKEGKEYTVRSIGHRTGGIRLDSITLHQDLTEYEKCFGAERFELVNE